MGKRYVSIWFRYLKTDWAAIRQKGLADQSFVIAAPDHGRKMIVAANAHAASQGIEPGMSVADAKALLRDIIVMDDDGSAGKVLLRLAHWCIRFSPAIMLDGDDGIVLDAAGCAHLWGGEEKYLDDLREKLQRFGFTVRMAMADTIGAAWAVARFSAGEKIVPAGEQMAALLPLPPAALRLETDTCEQLHKLGLRQVKNFIGMPRTSLQRRFGNDCIQKIGYALGYETEIRPLIIQPEPWTERLPCLEPIAYLPGIEIALRKLLEALCLRLKKEGKGLRTAVLKGYRIDGKTVSINIGTGKPSHNETHLHKLFALKFESFAPGPGIELFTLDALQVANTSPDQTAIWGHAGGVMDDAVSELLDRLTNKLGEGHFHRYLPDEHYWPERSVKKAQSLTEKKHTDWIAGRPRPLQLLPSPVRIQVTAPVPDYPPMNFRLMGTLHKVVSADGPERIEQEWWLQSGEHRDYYAVEDEAGRRYWLFRAGHYNSSQPPHWYLHGYFA